MHPPFVFALWLSWAVGSSSGGAPAAETPPPAPLARAHTFTTTLEIAAGEGCVWDADSARLLGRVAAPDTAGSIVIEAEHPSRLAGAEPGARTGHALDGFTYARYDFRAAKGGRMDLWIRLDAPPGPSRFRDLMNGAFFLAPYQEENKETSRAWKWVRRGSPWVRPGLNRFELTPYWGPVPRVDKIVLLPSGSAAPEDAGPEGIAERADSGWIETMPVAVPGLKRLIAVDGLPDTGAKLALSVDGGRTWTAATREQGIGPLLLKESDPVTLAFRVTVLRLADGRSPAIGPLRLRAEVDASACAVLENGTSRLVFDRSSGGLFSIECAETGDFVVLPGRPRPIVGVEFKRGGEGEWLRVTPESRTRIVAAAGPQPDQWVRKEMAPLPHRVAPARVAVEANRLEVEYLFSADGVGRARATCVVEPADGGLWRFAVTVASLEGPADVVGVIFPILEHVRIGASGLDDRQLRLQAFGHAAVHPGRLPIRDARYLGGAVMPWTSVHDERTGLYVCAQDPGATNVLFQSKSGGPAAEHFAMSTTKLDAVRPGEVRTYEYVVAAHPGDWHWGADRYREWFYRTHGRARAPAWLRRSDGWIDLQAENCGETFRFDQLGDWLTRARAIGLDWIQVWGQFSHEWGTCCGAIYPPSPLYGGEQGWRDACRVITARGGHVGGYFLAERIDLLPLLTGTFLGRFKVSDYPAGTSWPTHEFIERVRFVADPKGSVPPWPPEEKEIADYRRKIEEHRQQHAEGKRATSVQWWLKPYVGDPEWHAYLRRWIVDRYLLDYGSNTAYIDVLGCGAAEESYDPRRGHNGEGGWGRGKAQLARTVAEAAWKHNPDFGFTMEGLGDLPGLTCAPMCSGVYYGGRNVYRYTFPERVLIHGMANGGPDTSPIDRFLETFLEGMRYDVVGYPKAWPVYLLHLQRHFTPRLYEAVFRDTVGMSASDPRIQARLHRLEAGNMRGALITVVNRERLSGARLRLDQAEAGDVKAAYAVGLSGAAEPLALERRDNHVSIPVPNELAAVLFLPGPTKGGIVWPLFRLRRSDPPAAEVTLLNLSAEAFEGTCAAAAKGFTEPFQDRAAEAREALPITETSQKVSLKPWEARTVQFPIATLRRHRWTTRVAVTVSGADGEPLNREFLAVPLVLDGSWEVWGQADPEAADGERSLVLPPSDSGFQHQVASLWLEPDRRYRLAVKAKRSGFTYKVGGTLLWVQNNTTNTVWQSRGLDRKRPGEWQTITYTFITPPELTRADLYLYNVVSPDTAWFDDLEVEELPR